MKTFTTDRGPPTCRYPIFAHSMEVQTFTTDRGPPTFAMCIASSTVSNFVCHSYLDLYLSINACIRYFTLHHITLQYIDWYISFHYITLHTDIYAYIHAILYIQTPIISPLCCSSDWGEVSLKHHLSKLMWPRWIAVCKRLVETGQAFGTK